MVEGRARGDGEEIISEKILRNSGRAENSWENRIKLRLNVNVKRVIIIIIIIIIMGHSSNNINKMKYSPLQQ
jgi:hypothetical protein